MNQGQANPDMPLPEWNQPEPYFTDFKASRHIMLAHWRPWRVAPDDKRKPVNRMPFSAGALLNIYPDAIEIGAPLGAEDNTELGMLFTAAMLVIALMAVGFGIAVWESDSAGAIAASLMVFLFGAFAFLAAAMFFRLARWSVRDVPVLFNRRTRQVSFFELEPFPYLRFWKKQRATSPRTRSWDGARVRSYKMSQFSGPTRQERYCISLLWGEPGNPSSCADIVDFGIAQLWGDDRLWPLYEHIRRYMEEDGAPIGRGDSLRWAKRGELPAFPPDILAAAGGPALDEQQVEDLARGRARP